MPNWCFIDCRFDEDRYADIAALMQTDRNMFDFNQLIKEPPDCDWYDWRCAKWNTKWNAAEVQWNTKWDPAEGQWNTKWNAAEGQCEVQWNASNSVHYWTAWDAPWPIFVELSKRFPDVLFHYDIEWEEGFAAEAEYLGGEQTFYEDRELTWNEEEEE